MSNDKNEPEDYFLSPWTKFRVSVGMVKAVYDFLQDRSKTISAVKEFHRNLYLGLDI
jgi:hypothetical protein